MWVTAYTDASFPRGHGFWAIWLKSELGRHVTSGACPDWVDTNTTAEIYAAFLAIVEAKRIWPATRGVLVVTDCQMTAKSLWPWSRQSDRDSIRRVQTDINGFCTANGVSIRTKHIKGHQRPSSVSAYLNQQVDKLAAIVGQQLQLPLTKE